MNEMTLQDLLDDVKKFKELCATVAYNNAIMSGNNYTLEEATVLTSTGVKSENRTDLEGSTIHSTAFDMNATRAGLAKELDYEEAYSYYSGPEFMGVEKPKEKLSISSIFGSKKKEEPLSKEGAESIIRHCIEVDECDDAFISALHIYTKTIQSKLPIASTHSLGAVWASHFLISRGELPFVIPTYCRKELEMLLKDYTDGKIDMGPLAKRCKSMQEEFYKVLAQK